MPSSLCGEVQTEILKRRDKHDVTAGEAGDDCLDRVKKLSGVTEEEVAF